MTKEAIEELLRGVIHPETGIDIVTMNLVENIHLDGNKVQITLLFARTRDPFAISLKRACQQLLEATDAQLQVQLLIKEAAPKSPKKGTAAEADNPSTPTAPMATTILAISSAKGGVGKSTVTASLALTLNRMGYSVGVLDADIYGPSQPLLFGLEGYQPTGEQIEGREWIFPGESHGVKVMSIGFFINPSDALVWRGPMATNALKQMIHQTQWGELDFLLLDLPPGTGDVHLSLMSELKLTAAVVVSTPQAMALADVVRGVSMFRGEKVNIPVLGLIENMAWFTPADNAQKRYFIFGQGGATRLATELALPLLGEIPLIASEGLGGGFSDVLTDSLSCSYYTSLADRILAELTLLPK